MENALSENLIARKGERTRREILALAVDMASERGLEGLTIGRLAQQLNMSKSGLIRHFGSKEGLQLATVRWARDVFIEEVIQPSEQTPAGAERLAVLLSSWLSYVERTVFRGGCFFAAASAEFDGRPGVVREQIVQLTGSWLRELEKEAEQARRQGEFKSGTDVVRLAFEVHALVQQSNWAFQLLDDNEAFTKAKAGIGDRLRRAATRRGLHILENIQEFEIHFMEESGDDDAAG